MSQRCILLAFVGACLPASLPAGAADPFPSKPIRIVVPFAAGGSTDILARNIAQRLNESMRSPVLVENRPGGAAVVGADHVAKSAPDGYTLSMGGNAALVINPNLMDRLGYDPLKDFTYITQVFIVPNLVVVRPEVPAKTIQDVIKIAKEKPDYFVAGHAGIGTSQHLGGELFMKMTGVKFQQVPYRGTTQILPDLMGGRLNLFFGNISNVLPLVREGKLRAFAITSRKRSPQIPDLPTMEELGFKDFDATAWFGMMGPAGLPKPIVDRIHTETTKTLAMPDVRKKLEGLGLQLVGNTPAQFTEVVKGELPMWGRVIKEAGIRLSK